MCATPRVTPAGTSESELISGGSQFQGLKSQSSVLLLGSPITVLVLAVMNSLNALVP